MTHKLQKYDGPAAPCNIFLTFEKEHYLKCQRQRLDFCESSLCDTSR